MEQVIQSKSGALATLRKDNEQSIVINLSALMVEFCSIYKVDDSKSLTDNEIKEVVQIILADYFFLKWDDMLIFLKNAKKGAYGKIYGSLDMPTFFQMLDTYCDNRREVAQAINRVKAEQHKREELSADTMKMIQEFKDKQAAKRRKEYEVTELKELSSEQKLVNSWIADFKKQVGYLQGFLEVDGKKMSIEQYLRYRNEMQTM